tara:strand:+ start:588 stop:1514 length:927 start_codon:yes stop_codon:yes gene_type:complete
MLKAIMYHYVRGESDNFPYFKYLHVENFVKQLEYLGNEFGFISKKDFNECLISGEPKKGVVLTFDDSLKDHRSHVLPNLIKRGLWGIFYVPTFYFNSKKILDVHRIHLLLGAHGGTSVLKSLEELTTPDMLSHRYIKEFTSQTYINQNNDSNAQYVKRTLNFYISYKYREKIIDKLMESFDLNGEESADSFYMTAQELCELRSAGMEIGSHTINHQVMSKLSSGKQKKEIEGSFSTLNSLLGNTFFKTFCYPYGGFHTFSPFTENFLQEIDCDFSFNVESRNITSCDLTSRKQALPRFDCNEFPNGAC